MPLIGRAFFGLFLVSGFCGLVYEVVWLRLCMAQFGVTTQMVSIVLSLFMGGLGLGSWAAGRLARRLGASPAATFVRAYALVELAIALSGRVVPVALRSGHRLLAGASGSWGSGEHYAASGLWVALCLLPFCVCMGATYPLAMAALRRTMPDSGRSFSYLYVANVVGATAGTLASAFVLVELLGFRGTLGVAATLNALLAAAALALSFSGAARTRAAESPSVERAGIPARGGLVGSRAQGALFVTGLSSMAMEVIWVRQYTPFLGTVVYSFAIILALYLAATFSGSIAYRWAARRREAIVLDARIWASIAVASLLPLAAADDRWAAGGLLRAAAGIVPFCALLGFVTPLLVDRWSGGDPERAGAAYAVNVLGCILGPLAAGFLLVPLAGERVSLLLLAAPLLAVGALAGSGGPRRYAALALGVAAGVTLLIVTRSFESSIPGAVVRRDSTATVVAFGRGMEKRLMVNGVGMTSLSPITKVMAHLPLAFLPRPPRSALIICFGMGTSFRSALSWGVETTAVELVPSVPGLFEFFHADAARVLGLPGARIVVDDGRRFLERTSRRFDVVIVDPPPPVEAAGSSLLYSREFCETVRKRLSPGGVMQQWMPADDPPMLIACARALALTFRHGRAFASFEDRGVHFLASDEPFAPLTPAQLAGRLPPAAVKDLVEWGPSRVAEEQFGLLLRREVSGAVSARLPNAAPIEDDRPVNEYYFLRRMSENRRPARAR